MSWKFPRLQLAALGVLVCLATAAQAENDLVVSWKAPTVNTDNTPTRDLHAYYLWEGSTPHNLARVLVASSSESHLTFYNARTGWHYFAMSTINKEGVESARSATVAYYVP